MGVALNTWVVVKGVGPCRIDTIEPGAMVLTEQRRFRRVTHVMDEGIKPAVEMRTRANRRLVISRDQRLLTAPSRYGEDRSDWGWQHPHECRQGLFDDRMVQLLPSPGDDHPWDIETLHRVMAMVLGVAFAERLEDGGYRLHPQDNFQLEHLTTWLGDAGVTVITRGDESFVETLPYMDDCPVTGCRLPRILFTLPQRHMKMVVDRLLDHHGWGWAYGAGHYLRASTWEDAQHYMHILLRAGYSAEVDTGYRGEAGYRWVLGQGPIWRVTIRNPSDHPVSRVTRIKNNDVAVDRIYKVDPIGNVHCLSLRFDDKKSKGFSANDIAVEENSTDSQDDSQRVMEEQYSGT